MSKEAEILVSTFLMRLMADQTPQADAFILMLPSSSFCRAVWSQSIYRSSLQVGATTQKTSTARQPEPDEEHDRKLTVCATSELSNPRLTNSEYQSDAAVVKHFAIFMFREN